MRGRFVGPLGALTGLVLVLGLAGCGDDTPAAPTSEADAWCTSFFEVEEFIDTLEPAVSDEELQAAAAQILPVWSRLLTNAPAPVRDDIALIAEGFQRIAAGDLDVISDPRYDDAFFRIDDYASELCGSGLAD